MEISVDDRRALPRIPFESKAYLTYDGRCRVEAVADVSAAGLALRSGARLRPGKEVKVFVPLPTDRGWRLCLLKGQIVRREGGREGRLGIALTPGAVDTRGLLAQFVAAQSVTAEA